MVPRIGKSAATKEMYEYDYYPIHCAEGDVQISCLQNIYLHIMNDLHTMYPVIFAYPSKGSCISMTKEIVDRILLEVPKTNYYYISGTFNWSNVSLCDYKIISEVYMTGILRRKAQLKTPSTIHNGQLYCQNMNDIKQLAKRYSLQYTGKTIEENLKQAYERVLED